MKVGDVFWYDGKKYTITKIDKPRRYVWIFAIDEQGKEMCFSESVVRMRR